jgi:ParB family transcriptional regulator, chromosome partitioning protein
MAATIENSIYWLEIDKVVPNPYQPRREFDPIALQELSDSIRQYGILQPLVVSRMEEHGEDGSINVIYQLIAGERRLRASKLAGLSSVPSIIRIGDDNREKLELAIIENVVREDLNAVERAMAYQRLAEEFKLTWTDIGKKVSKSREYVSNTVRILMLPEDILEALSKGKITEGHTRPLLMLVDKQAEMMTLFKEMMIRKMTVREAEKIARKIAFEKVRRKSTMMTPEVVDMEENLASALGTRVTIEPKEKGGKILIDYFSHDELMSLSRLLKGAGENKTHMGMMDFIRKENESNSISGQVLENVPVLAVSENLPSNEILENLPAEYFENNNSLSSIENKIDDFESNFEEAEVMQNDMPRAEEREIGNIDATNNEKIIESQDYLVENTEDDDLYNMNKFTV